MHFPADLPSGRVLEDWMQTAPRTQRLMNSRSKGFTLIEVVIALAVLAVAFFGMISVVTYTTRMNLASQQRTTATRAAEKKIEQMLNTALFDDIYARFSMIGSTDQGLGWDKVDGLEYFQLSDPIELTM